MPSASPIQFFTPIMILFVLLCIYHLVFLLVGAKDGGRTYDTDDDDSSSSSSSPTQEHSSSTYTSPSPSLSSYARLQFQSPVNTTACGSMSFTWSYEGPRSVPLTVQITDSFAMQAALVPGYSRLMATFRTLTTDVPSTASQLDWNPVDVGEGMYSVVAFDTMHTVGIYTQSPPFFVASDQNQYCLSASSSSSSVTSPSPTTSDGPAVTSPSVRNSGVHLTPRALAGTIAGLIAGLIIIIAAFTVPRFLRHHLPSRRNRREGAPYYLF